MSAKEAQVIDTNVVTVQPTSTALTPMAMIERAVSSGAGMDLIEKLMVLQERWDANLARKAFDNAMAAAKAEIPVIAKNRRVNFTSSKGPTDYRYEDLGEIAKTVTPILAKFGLSYRFRTQSPVNEPVTVTCIISHRDGHSEENTLCAGRDESGNKNSIQAVGSALTYLQRMTLKAALGLAASTDDDGRATGGTSDEGPTYITKEQVMELDTLIEDVGADKKKFLAHIKVEKLEDIFASKFDASKALIERKRKAK